MVMKATSKYLTILVLLAVIPTTAFSRIYKCMADGETIFTYEPCSQDAKEIQINPNSPGGTVTLNTDTESIDPDQKKEKHDESLEKSSSSNP